MTSVTGTDAIMRETVQEISVTIQKGPTLRPRKAKEVLVPPEVIQGMEEEPDLTPAEDEVEAPKERAKSRRKKATNQKVTPNADKSAKGEGLSLATAKKSKKRKRSQVADNAPTLESEEAPPKKKKRKRATKLDPVYIIPDVERKETTFRGRLGYACLNTVLRNKKPASEGIFCSRTCRINSIEKNGMDWLKDLGRQNAQDMLKIIEWNEQNNIRFMRISSEMFPFASHETYGYSLNYCASLLAQVGALAKKYGHRLTTHPGQFTQLGSPREAVVRSSIRELKYHAEMLDLMGVDQNGVMIIHGGGVYRDKEAACARMKKVIRDDLPQDVRARLVLENDELCYSAADLLPICTELDIPLVFDYHHDALNPSPGLPPCAIMEQANEIFRRRGIKPKQHYSEPRDGAASIMELRAHSDRCQRLPEGLPDDMDLMIEAKDKEQAVLHLHRIYNLYPVIHASLRPAVEKETTETKGRKSARKMRPQKTEGEDRSSQGCRW
ncbi:UV-endonuclease UvdE [Gyrodon lividus]|nr:UV-endonuclease UvdE [Gyrodon lividus]